MEAPSKLDSVSQPLQVEGSVCPFPQKRHETTAVRVEKGAKRNRPNCCEDERWEDVNRETYDLETVRDEKASDLCARRNPILYQVNGTRASYAMSR